MYKKKINDTYTKRKNQKSKKSDINYCKKKRVKAKKKKRSVQGHMGDALALGGEEGRDKLRKAVGRGKYP